MVAVRSAKMFVPKYQTGICCHNPEGYNIKVCLAHSWSECLVYKNTHFSSATRHIRIHLHMPQSTNKNTTNKRVTNI
jgi:hypothetical protein